MKLKFRHKLCYGIGNLGYSIVNQTITNFFMFFGTSVLKLSGSLVGFAVALSTVWDAITDPVVGYISDNKKLGVFGYRNGYMLIGVFGIAIVNMLVWSVPLNISNTFKFLWVVVSLMLNETFCSLFSTPYGALSGDLVSDYNDRTVVQIYKTIFFILGMMLPSVLLNIFLPNTVEYPQGQLNPMGYKYMAIFCSVVMVASGVVCVLGTLKIANKNQIEPSNTKFSFKAIFKDFANCLKNTHQRIVVLGYSLSMISGAILTSVGLHFFTYCFNCNSVQITILLSALLVGMVLSQPVWYKLSLKEDKKPALLTGLLVAIMGIIVVMLTFVFRSRLNSYAFYIILVAIFVIGFGVGTLYSLPSSMYLDVGEYLAQENKNNGATFQSFLTFSYNISNALALFVVGVLLDVIRFNPNLSLQPRSTQTGIAIILFVGVLVSLIGSFLIFSKYKLKKKHFKKADN